MTKTNDKNNFAFVLIFVSTELVVVWYLASTELVLELADFDTELLLS